VAVSAIVHLDFENIFGVGKKIFLFTFFSKKTIKKEEIIW
jgi:hypothetical protein